MKTRRDGSHEKMIFIVQKCSFLIFIAHFEVITTLIFETTC